MPTSPRTLVGLSLSLVISSCALLPTTDEVADTPAVSVLADVEFAEIEGDVGIGMVVDLSADWKAVEAPLVEAVVVAIDARNAADGIMGERLGLEVLDGRNDVEVTIDAVEALIARDVRVIIMGCEPETVIPAAQVANEAGVLVMSPCITADDFALEVGERSFSTGVPDTQQGVVLADRAIATGAVSAITIADVIDESAHTRCQSFSRRFKASGGTTTATIEFGASGVLLDRVGATLDQFIAPDVVVICATPNDVAALVRQVRNVRPSVSVLLGTEGDTGFWVEGATLNDLELITASSLHGRRSVVDDGLLAVFDPPATASAELLAFALVELFVESSLAVGSADPELVAAFLVDHSVDHSVDRLLLGTLSYDGDHRPLWSRLGIVQVENGLAKLVDVYDPSKPPAPPPPNTTFVATTEAPSQ